MALRDRDLVPEKKKKISYADVITGIILGLGLGYLCILGVQYLWIYPAVTKTISMEPAISPGSRVTVNRLAWKKSLQRGDIVFIKHPDDETLMLLRIIGLPGDRIEIKGGRVFVNTSELSTDWEREIQKKKPFVFDLKAFIVPDGKIFLLGDNRSLSLDSRQLGSLSMDLLHGKIL